LSVNLILLSSSAFRLTLKKFWSSAIVRRPISLPWIAIRYSFYFLSPLKIMARLASLSPFFARWTFRMSSDLECSK
jgi:hypothetical protein